MKIRKKSKKNTKNHNIMELPDMLTPAELPFNGELTYRDVTCQYSIFLNKETQLELQFTLNNRRYYGKVFQNWKQMTNILRAMYWSFPELGEIKSFDNKIMVNHTNFMECIPLRDAVFVRIGYNVFQHVMKIGLDLGLLSVPYAVQTREQMSQLFHVSRSGTPVNYWLSVLMSACHVLIHSECQFVTVPLPSLDFHEVQEKCPSY